MLAGWLALFVVDSEQYRPSRLAFLPFSCPLGLLEKEEAHEGE